jgi:hypothetical protein
MNLLQPRETHLGIDKTTVSIEFPVALWSMLEKEERMKLGLNMLLEIQSQYYKLKELAR